MARYTQGHHESVLRSHRWRTAANSAGYLLPHLVEGAAVLDAGCGPGSITQELADLVGPDGSVLGIDNAEEVIDLARREHFETRHGNLRYEVRDISDLQIPDDSFDVVHAHQVLQHLAHPVEALREMERVTRPGGIVAVRDADYAAMTWHPDSPAMEDWRALYRRTARDNGGEPDAGRRLLEWARAAGLHDVVPSASVWCFATPEDRQWWGGLQADRITRSAIAEQVLSASTADREALERMAAAWREWADKDTAWFAVLHGELLCRVPGGRP
jgi:ubiquinone/menaquinone biosynthesis C-methylase UbiE